MKCLRCKTENKITSSYCEKCGAPLRLRRRIDQYKKRKVLMILVVLLAWFGGFAYFFRDVLLMKNPVSIPLSNAERNAIEHKKQAKKEGLTERKRMKMAAMLRQNEEQNVTAGSEASGGVKNSTSVRQKVEKLSTGWVSIVDPWGRQVTKLRAALAGSGWIALPSRACLGGTKWAFYQDYGEHNIISSGRWAAGNMVGIWHLAQNSTAAGPGLSVWNTGQTADWFSLESANTMHSIQLTAGSVQGDFVACQLPDSLNEIGVFVQDGNIVGWTFGQWLINGYMWAGKTGKELQTGVSVRGFYDQTFVGGREEAVAKALGSSNSSLEQLTALVGAYKLSAKLVLEDTPYYLLPEEVVKQIRKLADLEINAGNGSRVVKILNDEALQEIGDINLLMDVVPVVTSASGFESAISLIEGTGRAIVQAGGKDVPKLNLLHSKLYREWLQSLVTVRSVNQGMQIWKAARAYYPDDPYIHLLGVELFLLNNNWREAERLLYSRSYPASLQDRYNVLVGRVSEMKGQEGKIVIHFTPGANRIPVSVLLNGRMQKTFMVDTGASMVTISSDAADALGLKVVPGYHGNTSQTVSTAGGSVTAGQVLIDTLEIDGWVERDVRALVIDIPGQPGMGLLGLNYLQRFKMNLNNDSGTLLLTPK